MRAGRRRAGSRGGGWRPTGTSAGRSGSAPATSGASWRGGATRWPGGGSPTATDVLPPHLLPDAVAHWVDEGVGVRTDGLGCRIAQHRVDPDLLVS